MLLDCWGSFAVGQLSKGLVLGKHVLRTDHFVEIIRQPVFVLRQQAVAFHRSLDFADFTWDVSIFDCFSAFCHFRPKLLCREHGNLPSWHGPNALALGGAVMSGYWMFGSYMGTITSNCDAYYANPGIG